MSGEPETKHAGGPADGATVPKAGAQFGRYRLERMLGQGGMGAVFLASDEQLKRTVAIKILPRERAENPTLVKRFHAEAQAAAQLRHDNIVTVYEAGEANGFLYMTLEFVDGQDVFQMLSHRKRLGVAESIDIIRQVTLALAHAYERGIVHRDIKPSNLLVDQRGLVKLADMGLARSVDETSEAGITRAGTTVGTVDYMSPEQAKDSKSADIRSDVYSLGCTLYHMLTGEPPFPDGSLTNKLFAHVSKERPDPRVKNPGISESVAEVIRRMMSRSPRKRYQTPAELLAALEGLANETDDLDDGFAESLNAAVTAETTAVPETSELESPEPTSPAIPTRRRGGTGSSASQRGRRRKRSRKSKSSTWVPAAVGGGVAAAAFLIGLSIWATSGGNGSVGEVPNNPDDGVVPNVELEPKPEPRPRRDPDPQPRVVARTPLDIGFEGERDALPDWIAEVATRKRVLAGRFERLPVVNVGWREGVNSRFRDLDEAIAAIPPKGAVLRLIGPGPFVLTARELVDRGHLVFVGEKDGRSIVRLRSDVTRRNEALLRLSRTSLTLLEVDVVADWGDDRLGDEPLAFDVVAGDLTVRRSSVTVTGSPRGRRATVFRLADDGPATGRVLLDRTVVRAESGMLLDLARPRVSTVLWNSLLATDDGPAIRIRGRGAAGDANERRRLRVVSSTVLAAGVAVQAVAAARSEPSPTSIEVVNGLFAARPGERPTLFDVVDWPVASTSGGSDFEGLTWTMRSSVAMGWRDVLRRTLPVTETFEGFAAWRNHVDSSVSSAQFPVAVWPGGAPVTVTELPLSRIESDSAPTMIRATHGGFPGSRVTELAVPSGEELVAAAAAAKRPVLLPELIEGSTALPTIHIDADEEDLGRALAAQELPARARVVVTGTGARLSSPIRIVGKVVRFEFVPKRAPRVPGQPAPIPRPFVIRGRGRVNDAGSAALNAFLTVENGRVEIVNGVFELRSLVTGAAASWFLHVRDGDFAIRNCTIIGPVRENPTTKGLVTWTHGTGVERASPRKGIIVDSFLAAGTPIVSAELRKRSLVVSNSVLASHSPVIDVDVEGFDPVIDGVLDIRDSTLTSTDVVVAVSGSNHVSPVRSPLEIRADRSVFGTLPTLPDETVTPRMIRLSKGMIAQRQIRWFGRDNAFDRRFDRLVDSEGVAPSGAGPNLEADWIGFWGADAISRAAPDAVVFVSPEDEVVLEPAAWKLSSTAKAARWRLDGRAVGAETALRQQFPASKKKTTDAKPRSDAKPKPSGNPLDF